LPWAFHRGILTSRDENRRELIIQKFRLFRREGNNLEFIDQSSGEKLRCPICGNTCSLRMRSEAR